MFAMETELRSLYMDVNASGQPFAPIVGLGGAVGVDYSAAERLLVFSQVLTGTCVSSVSAVVAQNCSNAEPFKTFCILTWMWPETMQSADVAILVHVTFCLQVKSNKLSTVRVGSTTVRDVIRHDNSSGSPALVSRGAEKT